MFLKLVGQSLLLVVVGCCSFSQTVVGCCLLEFSVRVCTLGVLHFNAHTFSGRVSNLGVVMHCNALTLDCIVGADFLSKLNSDFGSHFDGPWFLVSSEVELSLFFGI